MADRCWRVAHAIGSALPGWLVLVPRRHVVTVAELSDGEAAALGQWQVRLSRALHAIIGCSKTYVVQFAEAQRFGHVHFHIVPRMPDRPPDLLGPKAFTLLNRPGSEQVSAGRRDELAVAIATRLQQDLAGRIPPT